MHGLLPLLRLLSTLQIDEKSGTCVFWGDVSLKECQTFTVYANRIRCMRYKLPSPQLHIALLRCLLQAFPAPLLPAVRVLEWLHIPPAVNPELTPGLAPMSGIKTLYLTASPEQDSAAGIARVLEELNNSQSARIRQLQLYASRLDACLDRIPSWINICSLTLMGERIVLSDDAFYAISQLSSLTSIHIDVGEISLEACSITTGFPRLKYLEIESAYAEGLAQFLRALPRESITDLDIRLHNMEVPRKQINLLQAVRFSRLRSFKLYSSVHLTVDGVLRISDALSSLLECRSLERLDVSCENIAFYTTDEDVRKMSLAWPKIMRISWIQPQEDIHGEHVPTIFALEHFARHCPSLVALSFIVNADVEYPEWPPVFSHNLRSLTFSLKCVNYTLKRHINIVKNTFAV